MELQMTEADRLALRTDYAEGEVSHAEAAQYPLVQRGSVRLVNGLYRTEEEERQLKDDALRVRLPGQKGYRDKRSGIFGLFRSIFAVK